MRTRALIALSIAFFVATTAALAAAAETAGDQQRTAVPEQLVGRWLTSSGSGSSYHDPATGTYSAPNSSQFAYEFQPDGTFEHAALIQSSLYNCTMTVFGYEAGTVAFDGPGLTVVPQTAVLRSTDTCVAENNYEKPGDTSESRFTWRLEPDPLGDGTVLILTWPTGFEEIFRREE